ncbi:DUF5336 domain-containing protein [Mycobacterium sp. smrl_JER01]|uniref:DUF5336 domain-containing protein n=1 Tax=Mycobacterium sp. smrl_JER01 TaxID=3402633 RepID=UPI003AD1169E
MPAQHRRGHVVPTRRARGYPPGQQPTTQFTAPTQQFSRVPDAEPAAEGPSRLPVYLSAVVAGLGLLVYLSSFGPQFSVAASDFSGLGELTGSSFGVLFAVIAALVAGLLAAVGLLPRQRNFIAVTAVAAVLAFLLVLAEVINKPAEASIDWGLYLVIAFILLQAAVAVVVLLFDSGVITPPVPRPKYEQHQSYGQYPGYYGQPPSQGPQHGGPQHQQAPPQHQRPGYPSQYGGSGAYPSTGPSTGGFPASSPSGESGPPTPPTGFPTYGQPPASNTPTTQAPAPHQSPSSSQSGQSSS